MHFYKILRTENFGDDYQSLPLPHEIHIIKAKNSQDARECVTACCSSQCIKKSNPNETVYFSELFFKEKYFTCEEVTEEYVNVKYPELPGNPKEVRSPRVDEHYWAMRPSKFKDEDYWSI